MFAIYTPYTIYQCTFLYVLSLTENVLLTISCFIDGFKGWGKMIIKDGWKCTLPSPLPLISFIKSNKVILNANSTIFDFGFEMFQLDFFLAACDVEGNFLVVKAYQYTTLLSCMLLDAYVSLFLLPCLPGYCVILLTHAFFLVFN